MISMNTVVVVGEQQVSSDLGGEVAILNLKNGVYYGLDEIGARIWQLIQAPRPLAHVRDVILEEYDVEPGRCESDLVALLTELLNEGLVELKNGSDL